MLAEMGVAPKESDSEAAGTVPAGKKKKKKDKTAVKDSSETIVNGNGASAKEPKADEPSPEQPQQESIEVLLHVCLHICFDASGLNICGVFKSDLLCFALMYVFVFWQILHLLFVFCTLCQCCCRQGQGPYAGCYCS